MNSYKCVFYDGTGKVNTEIATAENETELIRIYARDDKTLVSFTTTEVKNKFRKGRFNTRKTVLQFTEMIEMLLSAGLSLREALEIAASINETDEIGQIAGRMVALVQKGNSFGKAIETEPDVFPSIYRGMIRVGEKIGSVEKIFPRLSSYLRERRELREKIVSASAYPLFVLFVALVGGIGLSIFIIPKMEGIFTGLGNGASTKIEANMFAMKLSFILFSLFIALCTLVFTIVRLVSRQSSQLRKKIDKAVIGIPLVGKFIVSIETLNFAFAMETLTGGGVPLESALEEAIQVVNNLEYRESLSQARASIIKGVLPSIAFSEHSVFPVQVIRWVAIGEKTGKTDKIFAQLRMYYQKEIDRMMSRFMALLEPSIIVVIGGLLLILVTGIVIPLFSMYGALL